MKSISVVRLVRYVSVLTMILTLSNPASAQSPTIAWTATVTGDAYTWSYAIASGADRNPVITGTYADESLDFRTIKYDSSTGVIWDVAYDSGYEDDAFGVVIDGDGNAIVTGTTCDEYGCIFRTIKYDGTDGDEIWNVTYGDGTNDDEGTAITVDSNGDLFVSGTSCDLSGANCVMRTIKYDGSDGSALWNVTYSSNTGTDGALGVAVSANGDPVITGLSCVDWYVSCGFRTIKYDGTDGDVVWNALAATDDNAVPRGIAIESGYVVVTGMACNDDDCDFRTIKYDGSDGSVVWNVTYDSGSGNQDSGQAIGFDPDDLNPVITGFTAAYDYSTASFRTMKLDMIDGSVVWNVTYADSETFNAGTGVAFDGLGNVFVTGTSDSGGSPSKFVTIKYALP